MSISFGKWESDIHDDYEQVKRIESARKLTKDIVEIDNDAQRIVIQGSGAEPFESTLDDCDCMDFLHRKLPCKHIYRLAFELGEMVGLPVYKKGSVDFDAEKEIEKFKELYLQGGISADAYVKVCTALSKAKKQGMR